MLTLAVLLEHSLRLHAVCWRGCRHPLPVVLAIKPIPACATRSCDDMMSWMRAGGEATSTCLHVCMFRTPTAPRGTYSPCRKPALFTASHSRAQSASCTQPLRIMTAAFANKRLRYCCEHSLTCKAHSCTPFLHSVNSKIESSPALPKTDAATCISTARSHCAPP